MERTSHHSDFSPPKQPPTTSRCARPSQAFVYVDEHEWSAAIAVFALNHPSGVSGYGEVGRWVSFPATRHGRAGTVSFADGHAVIRTWIEPRTLEISRTSKARIPSSMPWGVKGKDHDLGRFLAESPAKVPIP